MHEHDTDLIMALAEGSLDPSAVAAAEADIASCDSCRIDLEMQRVALDALGSMSRPEMNDIERARLHRTLRDELGLAAPRPAATGRTRDARRYRLFAGLAGAAAVLVAVVVVGPQLDLLGGSDAADSADDTFEVALAPEATVSTGDGDAPAGGAPLEETAAGRGEGADMMADAGEDGGATTTAPQMITVPPVTTVPSSLPASPASFTLYSSQELEALPGLAEVAIAIGEAKSLSVFGPPDAGNSRLEALDEARCLQIGLDQAPDATDAFILALTGIDDVEVVLVAYVAPDFEVVTVLAHDLETCEILGSSSE